MAALIIFGNSIDFFPRVDLSSTRLNRGNCWWERAETAEPCFMGWL